MTYESRKGGCSEFLEQSLNHRTVLVDRRASLICDLQEALEPQYPSSERFVPLGATLKVGQHLNGNAIESVSFEA